MEKQEIKLKRVGNLILAAHSFKIKLDGQLVDKIGSGTEKIIDVTKARELTVEVMQYKSKPIVLSEIDVRETPTLKIKFNEVYILFTFLVMLTAAILIFMNLQGKTLSNNVILCLTPIVIVQIYFMTLGRNKVIQVVVQ
jgi:hypothetical protein